MKTLFLYRISTNSLVSVHPDKNLGVPAKWFNVADDFDPRTGDSDLAFAIVDNTKPTTTATQKITRDIRNGVYGYFVRDTTADEIAAATKASLATARSGMSDLLATLPTESRAKFAPVRAAVEILLDVDDVDAAYEVVDDTATATTEEATVKATILAALNNFKQT